MHAALGQHAANVRGILDSAVSWSTLFSARPLLHVNAVQVTPSSTSQLRTRPVASQASANIYGAAGLLLRTHADRLHPFRCAHISGPVTAQSILAPWKTQTRAFHASFAPAALRRPVLPQRNAARQISLASVKKWWGSESPVPGPLQLWRLEKLEEQADLAPNDPTAQRTLYAFYVEMNLKNAYESLIRRWERTIEFSQQSPVLRDDEIFRLYILALVKTAQSASVDSAVRRRESVLAKAPDAVPPVAGDKSRSQMIAQSVVEDPKAHSLLNMPTPPNANTTPDATASSATAAAASNVLPGSTTPPGVAALLAAGGPGGKDSPIYVSIAQPKGQGMWNFLRFLVIVGACGFLVFTSFAVFAENTGILKNKAEPSEYQVTDGKSVTFADVHGVDEAKDELQEIVQFLKDPSSFSTLGGRLSKGVLLTGPPGTGKTLLARAVAGEAGVSFFFASGSEFDEMFVGVGAKRVRQLFKSAREKAPAIIFIDELDAIGTKRSARDQQHMKQTLNQLLVEMDGFNPSDGIIVIGATNFPQTLDSALVRPGRFDKKITVPLPDVRGREQILKHHLRNTKLAGGVDVNILARGTPGFSGADLENLCNQAAVRAAREKQLAVALKHLEWARDRIIMGAERRSFFMDDKVKLMTAYHEGGHALVAMFTEGATPVYKVTCMPRGQSLGHTSFLPTTDRVSVSLKEYRAQLDVAMGGRLAEEIVYGPEEVTSGCSSDLQQATNTARAMVRYFGMSDEVGPVFYHPQDASISAHERQVVDAEVKRLLSAAHERARKLLTEKREELRLLAEALIEHETLDLEEVKKVIRGEKIREGEKHAVSNVEITTITSPPLPIPVPDAGTPPVISSPPSSRQSGQTEMEDPPFISA